MYRNICNNGLKNLDLIETEYENLQVPFYEDFIPSMDVCKKMMNVKESVQKYEKGDFLKVKIFLMKNIIKEHQVVLFKALLEISSLGDGARRLLKLKNRLTSC